MSPGRDEAVSVPIHMDKRRGVMAEDILAGLRAKEEEMEALLKGARQEAASVREAALKSARELKDRSRAELEEELRRTYEARIREAALEAERIEEQGRVEAERLRARGERNFEKVVSEVMRFIKEPHGAGR